MAKIGTNISIAAALLSEKKCVAIPTETVYGLAANALDANACTQIFEIKNRPNFDPLIVHVSAISEIEKYVKHIPEKAIKLFRAFSPGPLTIVLEKKEIIPDIVTAGLSTVGIRIPNHALTLELLKNISFPLAAPSANPFGYVSPTSAAHVEKQLGKKIEYILDGGNCTVGVESTIIGFEENEPVIYRLGGITPEQIEQVISKAAFKIHASSNPTAPGQIDSHYAPLKPLYIKSIQDILSTDLENIGTITFSKKTSALHQVVLSEKENIAEAAQHIFSALRYFEDKPIEKILIELVPNIGIGMAVNDRIQRAAWKV